MKKIDLKKMTNKNNLIVLGASIIVFVIAILSITGTINIFGTKTKITKSEAKTIKLVKYDNKNFSMKIPEGWTVETCGENMYYSIRVYNPDDDRYQIFSILKAEPLLKNDKAKAWYENYYKLFGGAGNKLLAKAIVIYNPTVEDFYSSFNDYVAYTQEVSGSTIFNAPDLKNFTISEIYKNNSLLNSIATDDKILRATFEDSKTNKKGEGLFMGTLVNQGSDFTLGYDTLFYSMYNVMGISSAEYELINYEEILTESLNSLEYKKSFVDATIENSNQETKNALAFNSTIQQAYESYNNAWNNRQKTYDITSQKYSDTTLGYERVYDTKTGEIYKAYNGFLDDYDGKRYESATDDMYTKSVYGYIEK